MTFNKERLPGSIAPKLREKATVHDDPFSIDEDIDKGRYSNVGGILNAGHRAWAGDPSHSLTSADVHRWTFLKWVSGVDPLVTPVEERIEYSVLGDNNEHGMPTKKDMQDFRSAINAFGPERGFETFDEGLVYVRNLLRDKAEQPVSLNFVVGEEEDAELMDFVPDKDVSVEDAGNHNILRESVEDLLSALTSKEQRILRLRFGLEDGYSHTLEEIGQEFHVTRERIRQIEAKALRKLRHPSQKNMLNDFLE